MTYKQPLVYHQIIALLTIDDAQEFVTTYNYSELQPFRKAGKELIYFKESFEGNWYFEKDRCGRASDKLVKDSAVEIEESDLIS